MARVYFAHHCAVLAGVNSCTTVVNRRDLYSPEPAPDSLKAIGSGTALNHHSDGNKKPKPSSAAATEDWRLLIKKAGPVTR